MYRLLGPLPYQKPPLGSRLDFTSGLLTPWTPAVAELFLPLQEGGGSPRNLGLGTVSSGTLRGGISWSGSPFGPCLVFDGSTGYLECDSGTGLPATSGVSSMEGWVYIPALPAKGPAFTLGGGADGYSVGVGSTDFDSAGDQLLALYCNVRWITTGQAVTSGWHHLGVSTDASGNPTVYYDGVAVYSDTGGAYNGASGTRYLGFESAARYWPGKVASCSFLRRSRRSGEFRALHDRPWSMFLPPIYRRYVKASSGPMVYNLSLAWSIAYAQTMARQTLAERSIAPSVAYSQALTVARTAPKSLAWSTPYSQALNRVTTAARSLATSVAFALTLARTRSAPRALSPVVTFSLALSRVLLALRSLGPSVAFDVAFTYSGEAAPKVPPSGDYGLSTGGGFEGVSVPPFHGWTFRPELATWLALMGQQSGRYLQ